MVFTGLSPQGCPTECSFMLANGFSISFQMRRIHYCKLVTSKFGMGFGRQRAKNSEILNQVYPSLWITT